MARVRSPKYPSVDLSKAIEKARRYYDREGFAAAPVAVAAKHWGSTPNSSIGLKLVSALKEFGLMVDQGNKDNREVKLTELARRILLDNREGSPERAEAIKTCALNPSLHGKLWKHYEGNLPSDENLEHQLVLNWTPPFNEKFVKGFIKQFNATLSFAGLAGADTLPSEPDEEIEVEPVSKTHAGEHADTNPVPEVVEVRASPMLHEIHREDLKVMKELFALQEGYVLVEWPSSLSSTSIEDVNAWLEIIKRKINRAEVPNPEVKQQTRHNSTPES